LKLQENLENTLSLTSRQTLCSAKVVIVPLLSAILLLSLTAGLSSQWRRHVDIGGEALSSTQPQYPLTSLSYNQIQQKSSHNSFEKAESIFDQLVYHRIRNLDFDINPSKRGRIPLDHDFWVYHWDANYNTWSHGYLGLYGTFDFTRCATLAGCLRLVKAFHEAIPNHEVVTITLEPRDHYIWADDNLHHNADDLDTLIKDAMGSQNIYRPSDLVAACPGAQTLRNAVTLPNCLWPRLAELRGKFIFVMMNVRGGNYYRNSKEAMNRLAFTLRTGENSPGEEIGDNDTLFYGVAARDSHYFYQKNLITRSEHDNLGTVGINVGNPGLRFGVDDSNTARLFARSDTNLISTNKINEHSEPFSKTHNNLGFPFRCVNALPHCEADSVAENTGTIELHVRSGDIDKRSDNFLFLFNNYSTSTLGTHTWSTFVSVASSEISEKWSKGCLMARQSAAPDSPYFAVCRAADDKELFVQVRSDGCRGSCGTVHTSANLENSMANPPSNSFLYEEAAFIKLEVTTDAHGAHPRAYVSLDGKEWKFLLADNRLDWFFPHGLPLQGLAASSNTVVNRNADGSPIRFVFGTSNTTVSLSCEDRSQSCP
jgi:calcium-dependent phosphoinositide phospholipase C